MLPPAPWPNLTLTDPHPFCLPHFLTTLEHGENQRGCRAAKSCGQREVFRPIGTHSHYHTRNYTHINSHTTPTLALTFPLTASHSHTSPHSLTLTHFPSPLTLTHRESCHKPLKHGVLGRGGTKNLHHTQQPIPCIGDCIIVNLRGETFIQV